MGSKTLDSWLGRGEPCPASTLSGASAAVTARAAQVFADGFVQQPPSVASVSSFAANTPAFIELRAAGPDLKACCAQGWQGLARVNWHIPRLADVLALCKNRPGWATSV